MKKHSNVFNEIWPRPYKNWFRKHQELLVICLIAIMAAVIALIFIGWFNRVYAMDYPAIHKCIETAKYLNQTATVHLNVGGCVRNPYVIK